MFVFWDVYNASTMSYQSTKIENVCQAMLTINSHDVVLKFFCVLYIFWFVLSISIILDSYHGIRAHGIWSGALWLLFIFFRFRTFDFFDLVFPKLKTLAYIELRSEIDRHRLAVGLFWPLRCDALWIGSAFMFSMHRWSLLLSKIWIYYLSFCHCAYELLWRHGDVEHMDWVYCIYLVYGLEVSLKLSCWVSKVRIP